MKPQANDFFPFSHSPYRSQRLGYPETVALATDARASGYPVEVDVLDGEQIHFWAAFGGVAGEVIKYVQVGELPPRGQELYG